MYMENIMDYCKLLDCFYKIFPTGFFSGLSVGAISIICIFLLRKFLWKKRKYKITKINLPFGLASIELTPSEEDLQLAHKIWIELVTRKAAIPFDSKYDIIHEVYNSWYKLFEKVRDFIAEIPVTSIYNNKDTKKLINVSIEILNKGLRPHLTKWQAQYTHWYNRESKLDENKNLSPQELQRKFPEYNDLINDMKIINKELEKYADELKKII